MLIRYSVTNYRIFHETVTLSMEATKDKRLHENTFSYGDSQKSLLKMVAIYGANASGKTTIFQSLDLFCNFIRYSSAHINESQLNYTPFGFCESNEPTSMECELIFNGIRYIYGFSYNREEICEEHLYSYPNGRKTIVFEREKNNYTFKSNVRFRTENSRRVGSKSLYVSICGQFNDKDCSNVLDWAKNDILVLVGNDINHSLDVLTNYMRTDEEFRTSVLRSFRIVDLGIIDVHDRMKDLVPDKMGTIKIPVSDIWVKHKFNGVEKELPINMESSGTIRFLSVIGPIIHALKNGTTIVIDEIDMSFHTDLCLWVVSRFFDPLENKNNSQLLLNTHDVSLLDQSIVRRDQIFISIKDWESGDGTLRRLSDYNIRNDLDIRKAYLNGSFGGKPFIAPDKLMGE